MPTPIIEKGRLYTHFGTHGTVCINTKSGKIIWKNTSLPVTHNNGPGSSIVLWKHNVIFHADGSDIQYIVALDKRTGEVRWKTPRDEPTSWSSPHILPHTDPVQVVVSAANRIRSYDLANGNLLWECGGLSHNVVAGPVSHDGLVICGSSYEKQAILGIRLDGAAGDLTGSGPVRDRPLHQDRDRRGWSEARPPRTRNTLCNPTRADPAVRRCGSAFCYRSV